MGIQKLEIKGFRSLRDVAWEPGRLNVIIGPNASGKSNLLRALSLLQKAVQGDLSQEIVRMGGLAPLLWNGEAQEIAWVVRTDPLEEGRDPIKEALTYELRLQQRGTTSALRVDNALAGWSIYHDFRVDQQAPLRQSAVTRMEQRVAPDGQNLVPVLHTLYTGNREFKKALDEAMRAAFGPEYEEMVFPTVADQRVQLCIRWRSLCTEQSAADLSNGTIRFLLLCAILANPDPGALIAIDEPEVGLHPSMLPVIAELAEDAADRTQVILTTHSPQLLDAFTSEPPVTTVTQWVDGATRLAVVDGEELRRWLKEYSLGALFRSGELEGMV